MNEYDFTDRRERTTAMFRRLAQRLDAFYRGEIPPTMYRENGQIIMSVEQASDIGGWIGHQYATIATLTAEVERLNITINSLQAEEEAWYDAQVELDRLKRIEAAAKGMSDSFCEGCGREPLCGDGTYDAVCMGADLKQALEGGQG